MEREPFIWERWEAGWQGDSWVESGLKTRGRQGRKLRDAVKNDYSYQYGVYNVKDSKDIKSYLGDNVKVAIIVEGDIQEIYLEYDK